MRASTHANPHIAKRPEKLFSSSLSTSNFVVCEVQALLISHLSWILCRSPLSDSFRIAVDKSTATGESRGNACRKEQQ